MSNAYMINIYIYIYIFLLLSSLFFYSTSRASPLLLLYERLTIAPIPWKLEAPKSSNPATSQHRILLKKGYSLLLP